ncbi:MAG: cellulose biosynthesis protein BcsS, partial [Rickettsiales bacterium]|nr:cellulose biosynthesis protein BcsS [Rickettsiales bacterium]
VYAGPAYRHVLLSPNDPTSEARGGTVSARIQAEGEQQVVPGLKVNALAGTDISSNTGYWGRVRPLAQVEGDIYVGPEVAVMGDQDYSAYQVGVAVVGIHLTDKTLVGINGGYRKTEDQPSSGYGGLELGSRF